MLLGKKTSALRSLAEFETDNDRALKFTVGGYTVTGWHAVLVVALGLVGFTLLQFWTWETSSADAKAFDQAPNCAAGPTALDCKTTVQAHVYPSSVSNSSTSCVVYANPVKGSGDWTGTFPVATCKRLRNGETIGVTIWRDRLDRIASFTGSDLALDDPVARNISASSGLLLAAGVDAVAIVIFLLNVAARLFGSRKPSGQPAAPLSPAEFARLGGAPKGSELPPKLTVDGAPWAHLNVYDRTTRDGSPVLAIGKGFDYIGLIQGFLDVVPGPIWVLYTLLVPHALGPDAAGRYASDRAVPTDAVRDFLNANYDFFEGDARHRLWLLSDPDRSCSVVWDQFNRIWAYGPLDEFAPICDNNGLTAADVTVPPTPPGLTPNHYRRFDENERRIVSGEGLGWSWNKSPLQPADED